MITLFSFGYWGWGNATPQLVETVDIAEKARGFKPPIFVDIRLRRQVRAKGFQGDTFLGTVGPHRYRWMPDLGNEKIATGESGVEIRRPGAAADLLDLSIEAAKENRRIIFYCACPFPRTNGALACHRVTAADLLLDEAKKLRRSIVIAEWPGGDPLDERLGVDRKLFSSVVRGRRYRRFDPAQLHHQNQIGKCFVSPPPNV